MDFRNILKTLNLFESVEEDENKKKLPWLDKEDDAEDKDDESEDDEKSEKKEKVDESVVLQADDADAMSILDMIRLAGMQNTSPATDVAPEPITPVTPEPVAPAPAALDMGQMAQLDYNFGGDEAAQDIDADMGDDMSGDDMGIDDVGMDDDVPALPAPEEFEEDRDIEYSNTPSEKTSGMAALAAHGNDLHKDKKAYPMAARGDNPMSLEDRLTEMFKNFKA